MALVVIPFTFIDGTIAEAAQVNADFTAITNQVNGNLDDTNIASIVSAINLATSGSVTFIGGLIINWGQVTTPADGSAGTPVTFDTPFPTGIFCTVTGLRNNYGSTPSAITAQVASESQTGFTAYALGGAPSTTAIVTFIAIGN